MCDQINIFHKKKMFFTHFPFGSQALGLGLESAHIITTLPSAGLALK